MTGFAAFAGMYTSVIAVPLAISERGGPQATVQAENRGLPHAGAALSVSRVLQNRVTALKYCGDSVAETDTAE